MKVGLLLKKYGIVLYKANDSEQDFQDLLVCQEVQLVLFCNTD